MTTADARIYNHGSIVIIEPMSVEARDWIGEHVDPGAMRWGRGIVVEPRYVDDLVDGMMDAGLIVQ